MNTGERINRADTARRLIAERCRHLGYPGQANYLVLALQREWFDLPAPRPTFHAYVIQQLGEHHG